MNKQKQTQELAKIEGWKKKPSEEWDFIWIKPNGYPYMSFTLPDYHSHDELQRIIDGMSDADCHSYATELQKVFFGSLWLEADHLDIQHLLKATPAQKREAILKAYGKWEESE